MAGSNDKSAKIGMDGGMLESLVDALPALVSYIDREHRYRFNNLAYEAWFGQDRAEMSGKPIKDVLGDVAYQSIKNFLDIALHGEPVSFEQLVTFKSGDERFVQVSYIPNRDGHGDVVGVFSLASDVTALKTAQDALQLSKERLRSVLATTPDGIITIDSLGIVETFSPSAERLFGFAAEEVIGNNVKMLMPAPYRAEHDGYLSRYLETGERNIIGKGRQVTARRKDGTTFPINLLVDEINVQGSRVFTGIVHDISDRVAREEELRQAQKMEAVGQLTGGVAHDFNNLLTVIIGNLEMLEMRLTDLGKSDVLLQEAMEAAELGAQLTARMLAFARRQPLEPKAIDLNALVLDMTDMLKRTLGESVEITVQLAESLSTTEVDPSQLQNALLNLCINARDAMPDGGQLTIETTQSGIDEDYAKARPDVTPGDYVVLSVSDNGTGMTQEVQQRALDPFFTTKEVGSGTGLGLSTVYGFSKQSGGHLRVYSEEGVGTTVSLYLPQHGGIAQSTDDEEVPDDVDAPQKTILVVEDDHRVRATTVARVKQLGYEVLEAADGETALEFLEKTPSVDLLFTDVVMPGGMMGGELAAKAVAMKPDLRVLFTSGYTEQASIQAGTVEEGAVLLSKPYRLPELARKLREVLDC